MDPIIAAIIIATIAAIPPTLAALATLRQGRAAVVQNAAISHKADEIHVLVNGGVLALKAELAVAQQRIEQLQVRLSEKNRGVRAKRRAAKQS